MGIHVIAVAICSVLFLLLPGGAMASWSSKPDSQDRSPLNLFAQHQAAWTVALCS